MWQLTKIKVKSRTTQCFRYLGLQNLIASDQMHKPFLSMLTSWLARIHSTKCTTVFNWMHLWFIINELFWTLEVLQNQNISIINLWTPVLIDTPHIRFFYAHESSWLYIENSSVQLIFKNFTSFCITQKEEILMSQLLHITSFLVKSLNHQLINHANREI